MSELSKLQEDASAAINAADSLDTLEKIRVEYLGKSGSISLQMRKIGSLPDEDKKTFGAEVNKIRSSVVSLLDSKKEALEKYALNQQLESESIDITIPARAESKGSIHPVSQVIDEVSNIFATLGFTEAKGPDIEADWNNFQALNFPLNHPAREMQDTFFMQSKDEEGNPYLLRTHTSSVQIRHMTEHGAPCRIICSGRTYRCDSDQTHSPMFHQIEGLCIDKNIHMGHLKGALQKFISDFFASEDIPMRFRPSFFPFVEPGAEVDIGYVKRGGELKLGTAKQGEEQGWLEILGCGMVHPNVLKSVNIDSGEYQGFAFGVGVERLAMLKYGVTDLRAFFESDVRFLNHYGFSSLDNLLRAAR